MSCLNAITPPQQSLANELLITCPLSMSAEVRTFSVPTSSGSNVSLLMQPGQDATSWLAWLYEGVDNPAGFAKCSSDAAVVPNSAR